MEIFIVVRKLLIATLCWITFQTGVYGAVGDDPWKQMEYFVEQTIPEPPRIITEPGTISQYPDRFSVRWETPIDNTDPVQEFSVRYSPVERTIKGWVENGPAVEKTYLSWERNQYLELRELTPDTYYKIEIRVINKHGSSLPDTVVIKTRAAEFDASFTLQNIWGRLEPKKRSMIKCFRDSSLKEVKKIRISRALNTGQGWNLPRSSMQLVQGNPVFARILYLPSEDELNRFGAFQCSFVKNEAKTNIITLKLPPP
ncbi:Fasciclin-2, partial [Stegodyphus mimosarum]